MASKTLILNAEQVRQKITRIACEIYENHSKEKKIIIVGISKRGFIHAKRIASELSSISNIAIELAELTMNKKDVHQPVILSVDASALKNKPVVLVDDVLNSGAVLMFAAKNLLDTGLQHLSTAVLVDRRHRSYPIRADFVGLTLSTTLQEHISVEFDEKGKNDAVYLM